jgi:hypothetical protein
MILNDKDIFLCCGSKMPYNIIKACSRWPFISTLLDMDINVIFICLLRNCTHLKVENPKMVILKHSWLSNNQVDFIHELLLSNNTITLSIDDFSNIFKSLNYLSVSDMILKRLVVFLHSVLVAPKSTRQLLTAYDLHKDLKTSILKNINISIRETWKSLLNITDIADPLFTLQCEIAMVIPNAARKTVTMMKDDHTKIIGDKLLADLPHDLIKLVSEDMMVVAGGSIEEFLGESWMSLLPVRYVDFFVFDTLYQTRLITDAVYILRRNGYKVCHGLYPDRLVGISEWSSRVVQIISTSMKDISSLLNSFEVHCSRFVFTGSSIIGTLGAIHCLKTRTCYDGDNVVISAHELAKQAMKGFTLTDLAKTYLSTSEVGFPIKTEVKNEIKFAKPFMVGSSIIPLLAQKISLEKVGYKTWTTDSKLIYISNTSLYTGNDATEYIRKFVKQINYIQCHSILSCDRLLRVYDLKISYVYQEINEENCQNIVMQCKHPENCDTQLLLEIYNRLCGTYENTPFNKFNMLNLKFASDFAIFRNGIKLVPPESKLEWCDIVKENKLVMAYISPRSVPYNIGESLNYHNVIFTLHCLFLS